MELWTTRVGAVTGTDVAELLVKLPAGRTRGPAQRIYRVDLVDAPVSKVTWDGGPGDPVSAVAYELLCRAFDRDSRPIVTARSKDEFEVARSSTSDAFRALRAADLVTDTGQPVVPQLFWELVKVWAPTDRRWLASVPDPADWDDPHDPAKTTWRLAGLEAAVFHGAPAVGVGEGPVELYVPGPVLLSIATRRYGVADAVAAAASVAVPAAHQVTRARDDRERMHRGWLVVHPVAAALDLGALGDARSQQILAEWRPRDGEAVWREP